MITTLLIIILGILQPIQEFKRLKCIGKIHKQESQFLSSDSHDYYLYFENDEIVKTSEKLYVCYEKGDTAHFFYRHFKDNDGKYKYSKWQMINKCPDEL